MNWIIFIAGILALIFGTIFCFLGYSSIQKKKEIEEENRRIEEENQQLIKTNIKLDTIRSNLESKNKELAQQALEQAAIAAQNAAEQQRIMADSLAQYCDTLEAAYLAEENKFDLKVSHLTEIYEQMQERLSNEYEQDKKTTREAFHAYVEILCGEYSKAEEHFDNELAKMSETIALRKEELDEIAATWKAAREAQIREEEMLLKSDFYRLHLSELDANTIELIEQLKPRLPEPRVLSMLIWSTYFQKQTTALCNNILGINKVCGIYKITNIKTGLCYIGQAVDIADRWKQHIKCDLGIDTPAQNKLYKAMLRDGITNFTFELLEQCERNLLNEKEKFYIGLYQSCDYGYNSTSGNK
jgi:hypothetical protein